MCIRDRILREAMRQPVRPRGADSAKVIPVIVTKSIRGLGTEEDMVRVVTQYWSLEGKLLAENDPCETKKE